LLDRKWERSETPMRLSLYHERQERESPLLCHWQTGPPPAMTDRRLPASGGQLPINNVIVGIERPEWGNSSQEPTDEHHKNGCHPLVKTLPGRIAGAVMSRLHAFPAHYAGKHATLRSKIRSSVQFLQTSHFRRPTPTRPSYDRIETNLQDFLLLSMSHREMQHLL